MLYYKFKNYEEFKDMFGIIKHGNGVCSRKNKILLAYVKDKRLLHEAVEKNDYSYFLNGGIEEDHYPDNNYKRALRYVITLCLGAGRRLLLLQEL